MRREIRERLTLPPADKVIPSRAFSRATGATLNQLQWWATRGYLVPAFGMVRHVRLYSVDQISEAKRLLVSPPWTPRKRGGRDPGPMTRELATRLDEIAMRDPVVAKGRI